MATLSEYVKDQLGSAVERSDLSSVQVVGWDSQPTEEWAIAWSPLAMDVEGSLGGEAAGYTIAVALFAPVTSTADYEKHCMTPSARGSLIGEVSRIGWNWSDWEFGNESPNDSGVKLAASAMATLPAITDFRDDGITYIDTQIVFWDIDNAEPYTGEIVIDHKLTEEGNGIHRVELIDGTRRLGVLNSGGYDIVVAGGGDEPRLWTLEIDEEDEQVEYEGEMWDLWRLDAIFKEDALVRHPPDEPDPVRTSGSFGINIVPQFVPSSATFYGFANKALNWTWNNEVPEGFEESVIEVNSYLEEEWDGSTPYEFEVSRADARRETNDWFFVEEMSIGDIPVVRPTGGFHRTISFEFLPPDRLGVVVIPEDGYDYTGAGEDWYALEFGVNTNAVRLGGDSVGDTHEGTMRIAVPEETIGGTTYLPASVEIPWRLTII